MTTQRTPDQEVSKGGEMQVEQFLEVKNFKRFEADLKSSKPFGKLDKGRGESNYLNFGKDIKFVSTLEFLPGLGIRGKNYHKNKQEMMFILEGKMEGFYWLPNNPNFFQKQIHCKGDFITIFPGLTHAFEAIERTVAIELSPDTFDIEDTFYPNNMPEKV